MSINQNCAVEKRSRSDTIVLWVEGPGVTEETELSTQRGGEQRRLRAWGVAEYSSQRCTGTWELFWAKSTWKTESARKVLWPRPVSPWKQELEDLVFHRLHTQNKETLWWPEKASQGVAHCTNRPCRSDFHLQAYNRVVQLHIYMHEFLSRFFSRTEYSFHRILSRLPCATQ